MQANLSAIGFGALLACVCSAAAADPTVTTTQEGNRNSAYVEQVQVPPTGASDVTARIVQIGNNNYAGDPRSRTGGIFQRAADGASAAIFQQGNGNDAGIEQDGTSFPVNARIDQLGNRNTGYITQHIQTFSDGSLSQTGNDNVAWLEQRNVADSGLRVLQTGTDNYVSFRQTQLTFGGPTVSQTGSGNSMTVEQVNILGPGGLTVEQFGNMNTVRADMRDMDTPINSILQIGDDNTANTTQSSGLRDTSIIVQEGDHNWAKLKQIGNDNTSLITQTGNNNWARVKQVGDGFASTITQTGNGNSAGVYQH